MCSVNHSLNDHFKKWIARLHLHLKRVKMIDFQAKIRFWGYFVTKSIMQNNTPLLQVQALLPSCEGTAE